MTSPEIKRKTTLHLLALTGLALALPFAAQAATNDAAQPGKPLVSTGSASHVSGTSAVLTGSVDPRTFATTYYFQYGPTVAYGSQTTPTSLPAGTTKVKISSTATGLLLGYHYRLVATNADGSAFGHDRTLSAKTTKSSFVLPKTFEPTPIGGAFVLKGTLTGTGNVTRAVVLQASPYPYTAPFANVGAPIPTGAGGAFAFRVPSLSTSTKFRVSRVGTPALYSLVVPEQVAVRVVLKARSASRSTGLVRLYGTVTPAVVGAHLFLQLEKPANTEKIGKIEKPIKPEKPGRSRKSEKSEKPPSFATKFSTIVKRGTRTTSRFSVVVKVQDAGRYRALVVLPAGAVSSGHSQTVTLHAAPSHKKKKKNIKNG